MKYFKNCLGIALTLIGIVYLVYISINNVDMTGLRLLITYWKSYILIMIVILVGHFMIGKDTK